MASWPGAKHNDLRDSPRNTAVQADLNERALDYYTKLWDIPVESSIRIELPKATMTRN